MGGGLGGAGGGSSDAGGGAGGGCSTTVTVYPDGDGDGYGSALGPATQACSVLTGYVGNSLDCADGDNRAHPGQTGFFDAGVIGLTSTRIWDFNCDGTEENQWGTAVRICPQGTPCGLGEAWHGGRAPVCGQTASWLSRCDAVRTGCRAVILEKIQGCR
jgi:hypothetical protein